MGLPDLFLKYLVVFDEFLDCLLLLWLVGGSTEAVFLSSRHGRGGWGRSRGDAGAVDPSHLARDCRDRRRDVSLAEYSSW